MSPRRVEPFSVKEESPGWQCSESIWNAYLTNIEGLSRNLFRKTRCNSSAETTGKMQMVKMRQVE